MNTKIIGILVCIFLLTIPVFTTTSTQPTGAALELELFGGFRTGAKIRNVGDSDAIFVFYNVSINGGLFKPINHTITGGLATLPPCQGVIDYVITIPPAVTQGIGKITLIATVDSLTTAPITKQADGLLLFFIIFLQQ